MTIKHTTEQIENKAGVALAGELFSMMGIKKIASEKCGKAGETLASMMGTIVQGNSTYESLKYNRDEFFRQALGVGRTFSPETVRLYIGSMGEDCDNILTQLQECNLRLLGKAKLSGIKVRGKEYVPIDTDTTVLDNSGTKKENIGYTYKGVVGYQPLFSYVGLEGYMLKSEMRCGSQHCQKGTPAFLKELVAELPKAIGERKALFRFDAGNDAEETIGAILRDCEGKKTGHKIIVKRNLRSESPEMWLETAKEHGKEEELRRGKKRYTGKIKYGCPMLENYPELSVAYEVIERSIEADGTMNLIPRVEANLWWTNLGCPAKKVIQLYHEHGTMEQYHSEFKTDMGMERMPSGKFAANRILLSLGMCSFNVLRFIGQSALEHRELLPEKTECIRKRIGKVILEIINMACKVVRHARQLVVEIWDRHPWTSVFDRLYLAFETL